MRRKQLLLRLLKLYVLINNTNLFELTEKQPLFIEDQKLPVTIMAKNGFHFSKNYQLNNSNNKPILLAVGCQADNISLLGGIVISLFFFMLVFVTGSKVMLIPANFPLLFLVYKIFWRPQKFIIIEVLSK